MERPALAPVDDRAPAHLLEHDAWTIAMAWQDRLQGHVRLVIDCDGPAHSIVESYAWVRIDAEVSLTRAAMVTWAALAACPGFRGHENAAFWKRVFSELQEDRRERRPRDGWLVGSRDDRKAVTDAIDFFRRVEGDHAFPRFMVTPPYPLDDQFYKLFTPDGPVLDDDIRVELETLLAQLRPYQRVLTAKPIDVCLRVYGFFKQGEGDAIASLVRAVNNAPADTDAFPTVAPFRIRGIKFRDQVQLHGELGPAKFLAFTQTTPVRIAPFGFTPLLDKSPREAKAQWLRAFLRLDGHGVLVEAAGFRSPRHYVDNSTFQALLSALPFARSLHSLTFGTECSKRNGGFEERDLPWIAYALFHPRAASSSWRHLELEDLTITPHSHYVLSAMARGNNLLALLRGEAPESDAYYSAQLVPGTRVRVAPDTTSDVVFTAPHDAGTEWGTVDVCGITSLNQATWSAWVAVIVPAFGLGYVRPYDLVNVHAHAPCTTQHAFGLHLHRKHNYNNDTTDDAPDAVLHYVGGPLGPMLAYLDMDSYTDVSSFTLHAILRLCPSLKVLVASHNGEFWAAPPRTSDKATPLEELQLSVYYGHARVAAPSALYLQTILPHLRAVRLRVWDTQVDQLSASRSTLETLLTQLPSLQYFHWRHAGADYTWTQRFRPIPYELSTTWTPRALEELRLTEPTYRNAQQARTSAATAFLSVVDRACGSDANSVLARLVDRGVLTTIFEFATRAVTRVVHIEPNDKNP